MGFSKKPDKTFSNSSFKDIVDKHLNHPGRYSKEDYVKAEKNLERIKERNANDIRESAKELDKHLIWASGGALVLASNVLLSDKLPHLHYLWLLTVAFVTFGISLIGVVISYKTILKSLMGIPRAQLASDAISEHMRDVKENMSKEERIMIKTAIDSAYEEFKVQVIKGQKMEKWTGFFNSVAFWFFIFGMVCFLSFGGLNIFSLYQESMANKATDGQASNSGEELPAKIEKAAQVAGQTLNDMAQNVNTMMSSSEAVQSLSSSSKGDGNSSPQSK